MILRSADERDAPGIADLMTELGYPSTAAEMVERLRVLAGSAEYHTIVAEEDGKLEGMVGMGIGRYYEKNGSYGRILALVVAAGSRGNGIGRRLLRDAESWLREHGAKAIYINSGNHREDTHGFYRSCGYAQTGLRFAKKLES